MKDYDGVMDSRNGISIDKIKWGPEVVEAHWKQKGGHGDEKDVRIRIKRTD